MAILSLFERRRRRVRTALRERASGKPRLSVHRSGRHIYAQVIDDAAGKTVAAASTLDKDLRGKTGATKWKTAAAGGTRRGAAVAKDLGLVYTLGTGNSLVALDISTGVEKWRKAYSGVGNVAKVALVYHDKRLYIGTNDGTTGSGLMVDATDGTLLSNFWGVPQHPGDLGDDTWGGLPLAQRSGATPWLHPARLRKHRPPHGAPAWPNPAPHAGARRRPAHRARARVGGRVTAPLAPAPLEVGAMGVKQVGS